MLLIAFFFTSLGTAIASVVDDMHAFPLIMNFLVMPLFFLSGALFPLENFPSAIKAVSCVNPLSFGVDGLRWAMSGLSTFSVMTDLAVLFIFITLAMSLGTYLFKRIQV